MSAPKSTQDVPFSQKAKYAVDNFMAKGGLSIFISLVLLFLVGFLIMSFFRIVLLESTTVGDDGTIQTITTSDKMWKALLEIVDAGNVAEDTGSGAVGRTIGILTMFVGLVLFSSMVGFIASQFQEKIDELRKGKSAVIETGHTLILGFGDRLIEIIRELIIANESDQDAVIVILAEHEKEEMDDILSERIEERKTTRLITRNGSTSNAQSLTRMGIERAKSIVILNGAGPADPSEVKQQADAKVLKTIMAVLAATEGHETPKMVAELHFERNRILAEGIVPGAVTTLNEDSILARMLVQTSRTSGLAVFYSNLVGFEGNEIYFYRPSDGFGSITFGELQLRFQESVPLGLRRDGKILLNPTPDTKLEANDECIMLAEDDAKINFRSSAVASPTVKALAGQKREYPQERELLVGWSSKSGEIMDEYSQYLKPGSDIDVLLTEATDEIKERFEEVKAKYPNINMRLLERDIYDAKSLAELQPEQYDNVIILAGAGESAEDIDSHTVAFLLQFRQYFKTKERETKQPVQAQLITEVMDSDNIELVLKAGVKDFLISNQFVSKIFAQVSQEPDVKKVYDDLFAAEGSEFYIKPANLYFEALPSKVSFADCVAAAIQRKEVCVGVRIAAEETTKHFGIYIIPQKSKQFTLSAGDALITLSEDES